MNIFSKASKYAKSSIFNYTQKVAGSESCQGFFQVSQLV